MEVNLNEIERFIGYRETNQTEEYICLLTGQLSVGKTKFLNRIMGHEYLPVGTEETTAVPTWVKKGTDGAVLYDSAGMETEISLKNLYTIRKGKCSCEKIEMSVSNLPFSERVTFIDTPGVNSVSGWQERDLLELDVQADAVFYFLAKSLSLVDISLIKQIYSQRNVKLIIVRTGIDKIKASEENIQETFNEEKMQTASVYPDADFYFVSLNDEETELNQFSSLMAYVSSELEEQLCERRKKARFQYCEEVLLPALNRMREEFNKIIIDNNSSVKAEKRIKKQLQVVRKRLEGSEKHIREQFDVAKKNYIENGERIIEKEAEGYSVTERELQNYVLNCMGKLDEWFWLEFEDIIYGITGIGTALKKKNLVSEETVTQILRKYKKRTTRFIEFLFMEEKDDSSSGQFESKEEAKRYLSRMVNSIFIRIEAEFSAVFREQIYGLIKELEIQYKQENEMFQRYAALPDKETKEKIDRYTMELLEYGKDKETA